MNEIEQMRAALAAQKTQIEALAAETLALQAVISALGGQLGRLPLLRPLVVSAFDQAADFVEALSIAAQRDAAHLPKALKVIEDLRETIAGRPDPNRAV